MNTVKLVKDNFTILYTYDSVGDGHGYSGQYVVLCEIHGQQHVIQAGSGSANQEDRPSDKKLRRTLDESVQGFVSSGKERLVECRGCGRETIQTTGSQTCSNCGCML